MLLLCFVRSLFGSFFSCVARFAFVSLLVLLSPSALRDILLTMFLLCSIQFQCHSFSDNAFLADDQVVLVASPPRSLGVPGALPEARRLCLVGRLLGWPVVSRL